jgi:hypothetical protein
MRVFRLQIPVCADSARDNEKSRTARGGDDKVEVTKNEEKIL